MLLRHIGRVERKIATARYIEGLLLPGRGKFVRPLAERLGVDAQSLQQALTNGKWDPDMLWSTLRTDLVTVLEPFSRWCLSERVWLKQGNATVGVANQRGGARGKSAHCQVSLELLGSDGSFAVPLASRLYLPEEWASDSDRRRSSEVPENVAYLGKPALAMALIRDAMRDGLRPGIIQGDSTFGNDREFRISLAQQNLGFFLEVDGDAMMAWDFNGSQGATEDSGYQPTTLTLSQIVKGAESSDWERCTYTTENGLVRRTRIGVREVFIDPGPFNIESRMERLALVIDWPEDATAPYRLYLTNLQQPRASQCLRLSRFQAYRDQYRSCFEEKLDLASYQGRSWKGFHHHLVLACAAYLFVMILERRSRSVFWVEVGNNTVVDVAIAAETQRLAGVLFRNKASEMDGRALAPQNVRSPLRSSQAGIS